MRREHIDVRGDLRSALERSRGFVQSAGTVAPALAAAALVGAAALLGLPGRASGQANGPSGAAAASGSASAPGASWPAAASSTGSGSASASVAPGSSAMASSAQVASASGSSASASAPAAPRKAVPATSKVASAIVDALGRLPASVLVTAAAPVSDPPAQKGARLASAVAAQIAGRIQNGARFHDGAIGLAGARKAAETLGAPVLVHAAIEIAAGKLRVTADVHPVPRTVWAKIRDPEPAPIAHAFAEAPIDAEVRSFLPPIPLVATKVDRGRNFESEVLAIACGDLDRDGNLELATVSRRRVTTSRIRGGKVEPLHGRAWSELAGVSPTPLREPYAFATLVERDDGSVARTTLDVALTDRAASVRFERGLEVEATFPGLAVPDGAGTACTKVAGLTITGPLAPCRKGDRAPLAASVGGQYDAFASAALVSAAGEPYVVWAGREKGVVELRDDAGHAARVLDLGAQLAVGDVDQDGDPEIFGSVDTLDASADVVIVKTWRRGAGKVEERLRIPAAAGVRALGVCPPDGPGLAPFVAVTADEIWVLR